MYLNRIKLYRQLEAEFNSKAIIYFTSDRENMGAQIAHDVIDYFINQLDRIGPCQKISLYLSTRGGITSAAWNIVNLLRMYCEQLQVIVPHKAHSAGTIISLGANEIVMTKQATLSPIDPSITTAMNPIVPNTGTTYPISVEAVKGYLDFAKDQLQTTNPEILTQVYLKLSDSVSPIVLGEVYRSSAQIKMLAKRLLKNQVLSDDDIKKIVDFLCSESGSHDYTINRREASNDLKLKIIKPTPTQYSIIKSIYDDICDELQLNSPFNPARVNGEYSARRSLLESIEGGSDYFVTEGVINPISGPKGEQLLHNKIIFEGWRHDNSVPSNQTLCVSDGEEVNSYEVSGEFQV